MDFLEFAKMAMKDYGATVILLGSLFVLKQVGLLDIESFSGNLTVGTFFAGILLLIVTLATALQGALKKVNPGNTESLDAISGGMEKLIEKVNNIAISVEMQGSKSSQMSSLITSMYEVVKGVPNKHLIYEILTVRTQYLLNNSLEYILDYIVTRANIVDINALSRHNTTLNRNLTRLKVEYIESVIKLSRNLVDVESSAEVENLVEKCMSKIYTILTEGQPKIEDALFNVNSALKALEDALNDIFKSSTDIHPSDPDFIL